ncbi:MAG: fibronectin type III domain-containing protein, partial [Thermoplasmata archaeon]|nr:fibronectin type III domain-containing protein [Thermoplasmata archaeon]
FIVSAWDEVPLESIWTTMATVTHIDGLAPAAPTGLAAFSVTGDTIVLEWAANTEVDLEGYNLYINQTGGDWQGPWESVSEGLTTLTFTVDGLVSETTYFFVLSAFDEVPNESPFTVALEVTTLDVTPPDAPILDLLPELTNVASQILTGTAEPGSLVTVFLNAVEVGTVYADPDGTFSYELTIEEEGVNVVTAWSTDESLNTGVLSLPASLVYDSIAPDIPEMEGLPEYTNEESITLSGTAEIGSTVTVLVDGQEEGSALVGDDGSWEFTFDLAEGDNVITLRATDPATNVGGSSPGVTVILDTEAPAPDAGENVLQIEEQEMTLDGSASTDNEGIATWVWTFKVGDVDETLEGETVTYTFPDPMVLTVTLTVTDLAGNSADDTVELDIFSKNVAPTLRLGDLGPIKGNTKTTFKFSVTFTDADGDNGEVWVVIDGESILMSPDPDDTDTTNGQEFTYEGKLVKGEHTYYFRGKDSFGNDAGGPSAGEDNAGSSPDVAKYETESTPGAWATGVLLAVAAVALIASIRRRRW